MNWFLGIRGSDHVLVADFEERKIGIPALLGTYYLPDVSRLDLSGLRATLAYMPLEQREVFTARLEALAQRCVLLDLPPEAGHLG